MKTHEEIQEFLNSEDVDYDIQQLIKQYSKRSVSNCMRLLDIMPEVVKIQLWHTDQTAKRRLKGIEDLINTSYVSVPCVINVVMEYFPNGTKDHGSPMAQRFFLEFCKDLYEHKDELIDSNWAKNIVPCNDYLKKVLENYEKA